MTEYSQKWIYLILKSKELFARTCMNSGQIPPIYKHAEIDITSQWRFLKIMIIYHTNGKDIQSTEQFANSRFSCWSDHHLVPKSMAAYENFRMLSIKVLREHNVNKKNEWKNQMLLSNTKARMIQRLDRGYAARLLQMLCRSECSVCEIREPTKTMDKQY